MQKYAIIQTGGKQYFVEEGDIIDVERLGDEAVEFKDVLYYHDGSKAQIGTPTVEKCVVRAEPLGEVKGPKVIAYKFKRRKNSHRKVGHRQKYSRIKITAIEG